MAPSTGRDTFGRTSLQTIALETVLHMLGSDDARVRESLAACLLKLTSRLFYPEDWPGM